MPDTNASPSATLAAGTITSAVITAPPDSPVRRNKTGNRSVAERRRIARMKVCLRELADANGLSMAELAVRAGLPNASSLYTMLNGWSGELSLRTMVQICDAFPGMTLDQLAGRQTGPVAAAAALESAPSRADLPPTGSGATVQRPAEQLHDSAIMALLDLLHATAGLRAAADDVERRCHQLGAAIAVGPIAH